MKAAHSILYGSLVALAALALLGCPAEEPPGDLAERTAEGAGVASGTGGASEDAPADPEAGEGSSRDGRAADPEAGEGSSRDGRAADPRANFGREEPWTMRPYTFPERDGATGRGIAYGPHRDGQRPGGASPSRAQLLEDLRIMAPHWQVLRIYGSSGFAETLLELIREGGFDFEVMLGAWIAVEETRDSTGAVIERLPEVRAENRREVEAAVRLAAAYPEIVTSISVGNETQVFWSGHRSPVDILIDYVREVRARTSVPVTAADDFKFWNMPESRAVADEVDFIAVHVHPLWNGQRLDEAMDWVRRTHAEVQAVHPDRALVIAETGWATQHLDEGEQGHLIKGETGEAEQAAFMREFDEWVEAERVPAFVFEAFDENWKGGEHEDEVEKHWGLFRADRTPKQAMEEGR